MTATFRLQFALRTTRGPLLDALAERSGVASVAARRAYHGRRVSVDNHLKLCAGIGIDPVTGAPREPYRRGDFHREWLGIMVRLARIEHGWSVRDAGRAFDLSSSALNRVENACPSSIESILSVCQYLGTHPDKFVPPTVSRETQTAALAPDMMPA